MHQMVDFENDCPSDCPNCPSLIHCNSLFNIPLCPRCHSAIIAEFSSEVMNEVTGDRTDHLVDYKHCMECGENFT